MEDKTNIKLLEIQSVLTDEGITKIETDEPLQTGNKPTFPFRKPFSCSECDKAFTSASHLKAHKRIHIDEKPFSCSKCDKKFRDSGNLKKHERVHTGEKPFGCSKCNKAFRNSSNLMRHEGTHTNAILT